jgi:uncharacterized protein (DUF1800 family)
MPATELPPLDRVDPAGAWQAWRPDDRQPWDLKWAAHLYRRAAFGAAPADLKKAVEQGLDRTLEQVLVGEPQKAARDEALRRATGQAVVRGEQPTQLRGWWVYWMLNGSLPLREKMTLFWHNHFATSITKVHRPALMYRQNELLYRHALGRFRPMLLEVSRDPAMLIWLDSNSNVKGRPNENYAREVMELFSLGVGNYSEQDIREAARAFTGWHTDGESFQFVADLHDAGPKTVLGQTGNLDGGDVVGILLGRDAAARFLVRKLYHFFISETADPPDSLLEPLAARFRASDYDIAELVGVMLRSQHFFSPYAYRQRIKSPVEFVLGAARDVARDPQTGRVTVSPEALAAAMEEMGQSLFAPPNVKGWRHGASWLNTATVLTRHNFADALTSGTGSLTIRKEQRRGAFRYTEEEQVPVRGDPAGLVAAARTLDPERGVALLVDNLLQGDLPEAARTRLINHLAEGKPQDQALDERIRDTIHALLCMPEYQLA